MPHEVIGIRPGEKIKEVMCPEDDSHLTIEFNDHYVIIPSIKFQSSIADDYTTNQLGEKGQLVETGFSGREVKLVEKLIKELDRLENVNDKTEIKIRAALFKLEKDLHAVDVMFLYKVIDGIGALADRAQKVGSRLQLLIAR